MARFWLLMPLMAWYSRVQALLSTNRAQYSQTLRGLIAPPPIEVESCFLSNKFNKLSVLLFLFFFFSQNAYAATNIQTVLTNLANIIQPVTAIALLISFIAGIFMVMNALMSMKKFGQMGQMTQPGELGGPMMKLLVGTVLIYLPTSTDILMNSLFGPTNTIFGGGGNINFQANGLGSSLLSYTSDTGGLSSQWAAMANTLVLYIQFLGLLSFIKGWFILSKSAGQGAQPGNFGKGVTHIIGGIIAINFVGITNIIMNTVYGG